MTHLASLADRYAAMCLRKWQAEGLPAEPLAQAFLAHGLSIANRRDGPTVVANALRDMAEDVEAASIPLKDLLMSGRGRKRIISGSSDGIDGCSAVASGMTESAGPLHPDQLGYVPTEGTMLRKADPTIRLLTTAATLRDVERELCRSMPRSIARLRIKRAKQAAPGFWNRRK